MPSDRRNNFDYRVYCKMKFGDCPRICNCPAK